MIRKLLPLALFLACLGRLAPAWAQTGVHCGDDLAKLHAVALPHASLVSHRDQAAMASPTQTLCEATYVVPGSGEELSDLDAALAHDCAKLP